MKIIRTLLVASLLVPGIPARAAADQDEGWQAFGHALTLVQTLIGIAARSDDPKASLQGIDDVLAGRNPETNRAIAGLLEEATADMPTEYRDRVGSIGRDLAALARREMGKSTPTSMAATPSADAALQARKDLTAMGLHYYDASQFLDAVKRNDTLAAELYIVGKGVNLSSRDWAGRDAADIARANGNTRLAELLARNLPAAR